MSTESCPRNHIRPDTPAWLVYLLCTLAIDEFVDYTTAVSGGTWMPRVKWEDMARHEVPLPPAPLAARLGEAAGPLLNRARANVLEPRTLAAVRDGLLPRLMSRRPSCSSSTEADDG